MVDPSTDLLTFSLCPQNRDEQIRRLYLNWQFSFGYWLIYELTAISSLSKLNKNTACKLTDYTAFALLFTKQTLNILSGGCSNLIGPNENQVAHWD